MRKLTMFVASFTVVLVAGAAVAQIGSFAPGDRPVLERSVEGPEPDAEPPIPKPTIPPKTDVEGDADHEGVGPTDDLTVKGVSETQNDPLDEEKPSEPKEPPTDEDLVDGDLWIEVLAPRPAERFDEKIIVYEGEVTPGARVFAGKYEADVDEEADEALDELEAEELELLDEEIAETLPVDEVEELRAIRREELTMNVDAESPREDEFVCQSCFLVKRISQLANRRKMICADCAL